MLIERPPGFDRHICFRTPRTVNDCDACAALPSSSFPTFCGHRGYLVQTARSFRMLRTIVWLAGILRSRKSSSVVVLRKDDMCSRRSLRKAIRLHCHSEYCAKDRRKAIPILTTFRDSALFLSFRGHQRAHQSTSIHVWNDTLLNTLSAKLLF
jgi:hypothetical protein